MSQTQIDTEAGAARDGGRRLTVVAAPASVSPELSNRPRRRTFAAKDKLRILAAVDQAAGTGGIGAVLRCEGIYSSTLCDWRRQRDAGAFRALNPGKRGPKTAEANPLAAELALSRKDNARLTQRLARAEAIIDIQKNFASLVKDALLGSTTAAGRPIEIWFQDEARVGQKGGHAYVWAEVGSCPLMVRDNRHDSAYLFGAICPARGVGAAIIMPTVNIEAMNEHLKEISALVRPGAHGVVVVDGAEWHRIGERLKIPDNLTLLRLPAYSPELNPVENVWEYLRANKLCALVWDTYEQIVTACNDAWTFL